MYDGDTPITYLEQVITPAMADSCFARLQNAIAWQTENLMMFGKTVRVPRLVAWYGDPGSRYTYARVAHEPLPWLPLLADIKQHVEALCHCTFNSVLANYYRDGQDYMGWHSDNESELGEKPVIASFSLGATRKFVLRHKQHATKITLNLTHGSLLIMHANTQQHWQHSLPKMKRVTAPRINLTFRNIYASSK